MPDTGSVTFFDDALIVSWVFNATKAQLTVSAAYNTKPVGSPVVLTPQQPTGQISGQSDGHNVTIDLSANFSTQQLTIAANQTNPARQSTQSTSF